MKIGILTLPQETNYGGILQAFALQHTLRKMGHEVLTIDRHNHRGHTAFLPQLGGFLRRLGKHYLQGNPVTTRWNTAMTDEEYSIISQHTQKFIDRNISLTRQIYSEQLSEIEQEYRFDAYVVGSDQVWLEKYCPASFLDFVKRPDVVKVTYAASCGGHSFFDNASIVAQCKQLAAQFSGISVREKQLMSLCKERLGIDAQWVLDPTMLLSQQEYMASIKADDSQQQKVFSYILDKTPEKGTIVDTVAKRLGQQVLEGNSALLFDPSRQTDINKCIFASVDDWLNGINNASFVVTDSFHGTVFAILFNKPFVTIGNRKRGMARFESLLDMFSLEQRLVFDNGIEQIQKLITLPIDHERVNAVLQQKRANSIGFLTKALK